MVVDNGGPAGRYTVMVSFVIDKNGKVTDVVAENNPGYGSAEEAIRVIKKSPPWSPAKQSGKTVVFRQRQPLTFVVDKKGLKPEMKKE